MANDADPKSFGQNDVASGNVVGDDFNFDEFFAQPQSGDDQFAAAADASAAPEAAFAPSDDAPADAPNNTDLVAADEVADDVNEFAAPPEVNADSEASDESPATDDDAATVDTDAKKGKTQKKWWPFGKKSGDGKTGGETDSSSETDEEIIKLNRRWIAVACAWGAVLLTSNVVAFFWPPAGTGTVSLIIYLALLNIFGAAALASPILMLRSTNKDDKSSVYTFALCLSLIAVVIAAAVLLTEFFRYDFTTKIS